MEQLRTVRLDALEPEVRRARIDLAEIDPSVDRLDLVMEGLLLALLVFAPLALGVVEAWSELIVVVLATAMVGCLALKWLTSQEWRPVRSWAVIPLVGFLLLATVQLIPLPAGLLGALSPRTLEVRQELLGDLGGAAMNAAPISFYANGTQHDLRLALAVAAVFLVAAHIYRRQEALRRLLGAVAILGAGLAVLAIAQIATGADEIYWSVATGAKTDVARGGPFVNRNNFCLFMSLAIGASLSLLLLKITDGLAGVRKTLPNVLDWITSPRATTVWMLTAAIMIGMASVFLSLSRGGVIALLLAATLTTVFMSLRRGLDGRGWVMVLVALGAFVCVLFLGFDAVYDRLATLEDQKAYSGRWEIVKGAATAWTQFPILGTGFGTHEVVFPMFDRATVPGVFEYAENEYAQMAEETGLVGLLLVAAFGLAIWVGYIRCLRRGGWRSAVAFGLGLSLLAAMVHSIGDFGLHLPANACLAAVFCGVLVGLSGTARRREEEAPALAQPPRAGRRVMATASLALILVASGWAIFTANEARAAESHWKQTRLMESWMEGKGWLMGNRPYAHLISTAADAAERDPGNVHYRYWLNVYRWRSISRVEDPKTGRVALSDLNRASLHRIVDELHEARKLCPTFGPVYCVAGQLDYFLLGEKERGERDIARGYKLAPSHPTVCFVAGWLDGAENRPEAALDKFRQALTLDRRLFVPIADVLIHRLGRPELVLEVAGDDGPFLALATRQLSARPEHAGLAEQAGDRALAVLVKEGEAEDVSAASLARLASLYQKQDKFEVAAGYWRRALEADYGRVRWRLALAETLASMNLIEDAIREARICLRLRSDMEAAKRFILKMNRLRRDENRQD